ncbi:ATP-binding protein [Candidatus Poribacteria bacterium]
MARLTFSAELENLELMLEFIRNGLKELDLSSREINQIQIAAEEPLVNIISYAYPDGNGNIEITYSIEDSTEDSKKLVIQIVDWGVEFDPLTLPDPDIDAPIEEREIGGLGVYMMRNIMDEVLYKREEDRNILTLVKY